MSDILIEKKAVQDWEELKTRIKPLIKEIAEISEEYLCFDDSRFFHNQTNAGHKGMLIEKMNNLIKNDVRNFGKEDGKHEQNLRSLPFHLASAEKLFKEIEMKKPKKDGEILKEEVTGEYKSPLIFEVGYKKRTSKWYQTLLGINPGMELSIDRSKTDMPCVCGECDDYEHEVKFK